MLADAALTCKVSMHLILAVRWRSGCKAYVVDPVSVDEENPCPPEKVAAIKQALRRFVVV